jgi:exosortase
MQTNGWLRLSMILALAFVVTLVYWPSAAVYRNEWSDFLNLTYTHGWLVLVLCLLLVAQSRREIAAVRVQHWPLAQLALVGCIFAWLVCYRASIQDLHITILPAIFWLAVTAAFGLRMGLLLAFPVAFFYLAVPSWSQLAGPLQELTVLAMRGVLAITGPAARIVGDVIYIPNGTFRIEEGCSGLHFMIVGLAVAALYGELRRDPWKTRLAQLSWMAALALLANWVRVYTIIEAGYLSDMRNYLVRVSHYWFGWGVFAGALIVFFWLTGRWMPETARESTPPATEPGSTTPLSGFVLATVLLIALPALSAGLRMLRPAAPLTAAAVPEPRAPWSEALVDIESPWLPVFESADRRQRLAYANTSGETVEIFRVDYRVQRQGAKLVGMGTSVIGTRLKLRSERLIDTPSGAFRESEVADRAGSRSVIWSRYETAGRDFVFPLAAQLWYGIKATVSNPSAGLIAYRVECRSDCADARRALRDFLASTATG